MRLSHLLQDVTTLPPEVDLEISGLTLDSRNIKFKEVFVAVKGTQLDGRQYIASAIERGAVAVLLDADTTTDTITWQGQVPIIPIYELQQKVGPVAARFYGYPAKKCHVIGVTGTSGKTSCTHFIAEALQALGIPCGIIGTIGNGFYGELNEVGLTTPDAVTLQSTLQQMVVQGAQAVAMEVSSHSIDQGRINGIEFATRIFTNLSQDHLDYHGDMQTYAAVKYRFLAELPSQHIIINADDAHGREWLTQLATRLSVFAYTTQAAAIANIPSLYCERTEATLHGVKSYIHTPWGEGELHLPLIGRFNLSNGLAVLAALCAYGISFKDACARLSQLHTVPGRMQTLGGHHKPLVVVDYAHKPDALEKVLQTLRALTKGKLYCVFGCGGERDRGKRPMMATIAERFADHVIVTNDNPRHEAPEAIVHDIMQGFSGPERVSVELDRSAAIAQSIQLASSQDCVLIAGKGAEHYQLVGDEKLPFDDVENVKRCLNIN